MKKTITNSDSLIGSLCREMEQIRSRSKLISYSLNNCKDNVLRKRLSEEIVKLSERKKELRDISNTFLKDSKSSISILLFSELCKRTIEII